MGGHLVWLASDTRLEPVALALGPFTKTFVGRFGGAIDAADRRATDAYAIRWSAAPSAGRGVGKLMAIMATPRAGP